MSFLLSLVYGDPKAERVLPFEFAREQGFEEAMSIQNEAEDSLRRQKESYLKRLWESYNERNDKRLAKREAWKNRVRKFVWLDVSRICMYKLVTFVVYSGHGKKACRNKHGKTFFAVLCISGCAKPP
jgi:hypothetical protein